MLLEALGDGWTAELPVSIGTRPPGWPTHFTIDLAHTESKTAVEVDGTGHAATKARDARKDAFLSSLGWTVLRFLNMQVLTDLQTCLASIASSISR